MNRLVFETRNTCAVQCFENGLILGTRNIFAVPCFENRLYSKEYICRFVFLRAGLRSELGIYLRVRVLRTALYSEEYIYSIMF